jgi:hypothetical protein
LAFPANAGSYDEVRQDEADNSADEADLLHLVNEAPLTTSPDEQKSNAL